MPIERYTVGRGYTKRTHDLVTLTDLDGILALMNAWTSSDPTVEGRLIDAERRAIAYLKRKKKPLDPSAPPYGDPVWLRNNERKSLVWYAINIVNTIRWLRQQIEAGDARLAADFALDLGVLAAEARMIQYIAGNTSRGGQGFRTSDTRLDIAKQHGAWRAQADELWETRRTWGALAIAKLIDPARFETIRKVIADRKPRKN